MQEPLLRPITNWLMRPTPEFGIRNMPAMHAVIGTSKGRVRSENQDRVIAANFHATFPDASFRAFVVCDGLGGMVEGGQCAALAVDFFLSHLALSQDPLSLERRVRNALAYASSSVFGEFGERGGSTLTAAVMAHNEIVAISVGDSRVYRQDSTSELKQISVDDTIAARVAGLGRRAESRVIGGPFANQLAQYIGQGSSLDPQVFDWRSSTRVTQKGDSATPRAVLLTTDGVHRLTPALLQEIAKCAVNSRELVTRLINVADWTGGHDNASALYVGLDEGLGRRSSYSLPGLSLHDAFSEFFLPEIAFSPLVRAPSLPDLGRQEPSSKSRQIKKKLASKTKQQKGRRAQPRKARSGDKSSSPSQSELEIEVVHGNE